MAAQLECALLSTNAYAARLGGVSSNVNPINEVPAGLGWSILANGVNNESGFLARAYKNETTKEIVIAYGGTTFEEDMKTLDWTKGNIPAATASSLAPQVVDAARFYLDVLKDPTNAGKTISFTGHSLGGGLASLMAVFFNKPAQTFDQAPFEQSATSASVVNALKQKLAAEYSLAALAPEFASYRPGVTNYEREILVQHTYVKGEILRSFRAYLAAAGFLGGPVGGFSIGLASLFVTEIAGPPPKVIDTNANGVFDVDLHDMRLLVALRQSDAFLRASQANPDFLRQLVISPLYANKPQKEDARNFLNLMIQQEALGNKPLDKLAEDIAKFKGTLDPVANGNVGATDVLKSALYQLAIGLYHDEGEKRTGATGVLFDNLIKSVQGGIQFTPNPNRSGDYKELVDTVMKSVLSEIGSYSPFGEVSDYLSSNVERYTLPTQGALVAPEIADSKRDLMLGNSEVDDLRGGGGNDTLLGLGGVDRLDGGAGEDTLMGGKDNDTLIGGDGIDTYIINSGDGTDTFIDSGTNRIIYNGKPFVGTFIKNASSGEYEFFDGNGEKLKFNSPGVLTLDADTQIVFQNQTSRDMLDGSFGLQLYEETVAPVATRTITGDYLPFDFDVTEDGFQTQTDDLGNIILDATKPAPGRDDSLQDSTGNDIIQGFFGDDFLNAWRGGDDRIDGGEGMDWLFGGAGNDLVEGGFGRDVLIDASGNDRLYADGKIDLDDALALENEIPSGAQGEALSGGAGDDLAIGGVGNDIFFGGTEDDILIGGAGDDNFEGDLMASNILVDWTVTRSTTTSNGATTYLRSYTQVFYGDPGVGGADTIYAGAGADWVMAGYGNDYVDGGNDADVLFGEAGNDDIFGGAGNDMLHGDTGSLPLAVHGNDYLDGEDGDDLAFGGGGNDELFGGTGADELYGNEGDDYVDGEDGADVLVGGSGADRIFGGAQDDFLQGDAGNGVGDGADYLDGEAGNDILLGLGGGDTLYGGDGDDQIAGDNGGYDTSGAADTIYGEAGNDFIDGQGGDDVIDGGADNDIVAGGLGNDQIAGGMGYDQLQGGEGNDVLDGGSEGDTLFGEAGNDTLLGGAGNDYLIGGLGDDLLNGGDGDDVYFLGSGEGRDRIVDSGGIDWLVFNNILWGQLRLGTGSLKISLPDGSEIHLDDFDPDNPFASGGIEYFQFADNTVLSKNQLINALGIQPTGTPEADVLSGTALSESVAALAGDDVVSARAGNDTVLAGDGADVVYGGDGNDILYGGNGDDVLLGEAGNDTLHGEAGNDLLAGGAGTDALQGGEGDDTYLFQIGDGQDTATDALGSNAVALGTGLTLDAITFTRQGSDLLVAVKNSTDRLTVRDWFAAGSTFASITLGDGTLLDHAGVEAAMPRNQAPLAAADSGTVIEDAITEITGNALANDSDPEGRALRVTNPGIQAGAVGALSLASGGGWSYVLANGAPAVQSLGAGQSLTESFAYTVSDDDPNGAATASSTIRISVLGANDLPVLGADSAATSEDAAAITGNLLSNDSDIDAGTALNIANPGAKVGAYGTLNLAADGAWTYTLAGSAAVQGLAAGQMVTESFAQTVSDGFAQVGGTLAIGIAGRNDAPVVAAPLADQSAAANTSWSWTLPAGSFSDIDTGDVLSYAATLADGSALPSWLSFSATTQTFSGRVPKSASGSIDLRIAATDRAGASATDVFALSFTSGGGGSGGGGGGNTQGNEGVGNGIDAAPPGHDASFNDGTGSGPGNPGAQGGNGYRPPHRDQIVKTELRIAAPLLEAPAASAEAHGNSAAAHAAAPGQATRAADDVVAADAAVAPAPTIAAMADTADVSGPSPDTPSRDKTTADWLTDAAWAYLDRQGSDAVYQSAPGTDSVAAFAQWLAVEQALARDAADGMPDWLDRSKGADLRGLLAIHGGFLGSTRPIGADTLGLLGGAELKTFKGLGEGLQKIA